SRTALSFLCLLVLAVLGLWWLDGKRNAPTLADPAAARMPDPAPPAELVPAATLESRVESSARESVHVEPVEHEEPAAAPAPLAPGVSLRGVLRYSHDGRPAPGQPLGFLSGEAHARVVTDSMGRFETGAVMPTGFVYAWHALEGEERARAMQLEPAQIIVRDDFAGERVQDVELELVEPDAWLRVHVTADGAPALASLEWKTPLARGSGGTDESGHGEVAFSRLAPGDEIELWAKCKDALSARVKRIFPWPDELVTLELRPVARIPAQVRDAAGYPLEDELVSVEGGPAAWTNGEGEARIELVYASDVVVRCGTERREFELAAGEE